MSHGYLTFERYLFIFSSFTLPPPFKKFALNRRAMHINILYNEYTPSFFNLIYTGSNVNNQNNNQIYSAMKNLFYQKKRDSFNLQSLCSNKYFSISSTHFNSNKEIKEKSQNALNPCLPDTGCTKECGGQCQVLQREIQDAFNKQINLELYAMYKYMAMATYFNRSDISLPGFAKWCKKQEKEEQEHAEKLVDYMNKRQGQVCFETICDPNKSIWDPPETVFTDALLLERQVNKHLYFIYNLTEKLIDATTGDFITQHFLKEQEESENEIIRLHSRYNYLKECSLGLILFDQELQKKY